MRTLVAFLVATLVMISGVRAQTIVINPRPPSPPVPARAQRVTINLTVVNAIPVGAAAGDMTAGLTAANQALFSVVDHQCDVLAPLLHGTCRLVGMTTNGNTNERQNVIGPGGGTISVTANATFELEPTQPK